ncbi:ankyrin repeat domain-containing protein [Spirillospora sp. NPDC052269]
MGSWSEGHQVVDLEDLDRLRALLAAGYDVEDDDGRGWTLLRHALDVEIDGHVQTGEPLTADITALLLEYGADPLRPFPGPITWPPLVVADRMGHWLAVQVMREHLARGPRT